MNKGKDINNVEVLAKDAETGKEYLCCFCNNKLIRKHSKYIWFFSHKAHESCIKYDLDNSEWASMQRDSFKPEEIEFAFDYERQKLLVDVNLNNHLAIMYSGKLLHRETFIQKTNNILSEFSKVMWVFDFRELINSNRMILNFNNDFLKWKNPSKMFEDYSFDERVIIAAQVSDDLDGKKSYVIFKTPNLIFNHKKVLVKRWLIKEQFIQYFNDIANKIDPEEPYIEQEKREQEERRFKYEQAQKEQERIKLEYRRSQEELQKKKEEMLRNLNQSPFLKANNKSEVTKIEEPEEISQTVIDLWDRHNINKTMRFKNINTNEEWVIKENPRKHYEKYRGKIYAINCSSGKSVQVPGSNEKIWVFISGI